MGFHDNFIRAGKGFLDVSVDFKMLRERLSWGFSEWFQGVRKGFREF